MLLLPFHPGQKALLSIHHTHTDMSHNINWAEKSTTDGKFESISNLDEIQVVSDCIIRVYYTPQEKTLAGSTTFYDYTVKAGKQDGSWGFSDTYYSFNQLTNDKSPKVSENKKLIAGTNDSNVGQNYPEYQQYKISLPDSNGNTKDANCYTGGDSTIPGLLKEIDDNGNVIFNYAEPGFFVDSDYSVQFGGSIFGGSEKRFLRKVYKDYTLEFARKGDTYTLNGVRNKDNGWVTGAGNNFYPLNSVKPSYEDSERGNNNYFGMRYDVTFKIGDYVGPLNYKFTGDDDLWVVLDGKKIVIDLGGIHSAATGNVDLWQYIGDKENLTEAQKQQTHTLTILYMERGAGASNCQMEFTLPSAKIQQVDKTKMTNISFYKTDADGTGLSGAQFTLTNDSTKTTMYAASESDGLVQFQQLVAGTYTLTETQAPKDYVTPTTSWKVKVTADGNNGLSTKIYQADGTTELGKLTGGEYQIINSASTPVQPPTPGIVETKKELSHEKYIAKNEDGTYNLTLNVSGAVGSESYANKLDVLFVDHNATFGNNATFVFQIDITTLDKKTETRIEELTFNAAGSDSVTIEKIPAGSHVKVTEVYSGASYELASAKSQETDIIANPEKETEVEFRPAEVSFINKHDGRTNGGYGVKNNFKLDENGQYQYTEPAEKN